MHFQQGTPTPIPKKQRKRRVKEFVESPLSATRSSSVTVTSKGVSPLCHKIKSPSCHPTTPKSSHLPVEVKKSAEEEKKKNGEEDTRKSGEEDTRKMGREETNSATSQGTETSDSLNISSFLIGLDDLLPDDDNKLEGLFTFQ